MGLLKFLTILLLLFYPLGEITRFSLGGSTAITLTDILVFIVVLYWLLLNIIKKTNIKNSLFIPFLIFISVCVLSLVINFKAYAINELFISSLYLIRWIFYACILFVSMSFNVKFKSTIKNTLLFSGGLIVVIGYVQYFLYQNLRNLFYLGWDDHLYRLFSSFFDPNFTGSFYVLYFLFLLGFIFQKTKHQKKIAVLLITEIITGIAIVLTYSRSALVSAVVSTSLFFVLINKKKLILAIIAFVLFVILILSPFFYIENINIFRTASSMARVESMRNALVIIKDHSIFGIGFNAYRYAQIKYGFRHGTGALISHADAGADNSFLFILATTGVVGLLAYLYMWYVIIQKILNQKMLNQVQRDTERIHSIIVLSSIIAVFIDSLFVNSLFFPSLMLWMWIIIGVMG